MLTKTEVVLHRGTSTARGVMFSERLSAEAVVNGPGLRVAVGREQWESMGSPNQVTVTVTPGDLLND